MKKLSFLKCFVETLPVASKSLVKTLRATSLLGMMVLAPMGANAQVTVGASTLPAATLDVVATKTDGSTAEGVIAPRLTLAQLKAADARYLAAQTGAIVYVTDATGGTTAKTANVTAAGYYYFDGTVWQKMGGGAVGLTTEVDGIIGNEVTNATDATLVRSGSGTAAAPYTLARAALTGDVTAAAGSNTTAIGTGRVTSAMIADGTIVAADMSDAAITANNGLTENTKNNIQLGGTLVQNTTINQSSYSLTHSGTGKTILSTPLQYNNSGASAGAGKVLTSDASGNATWQNPPTDLTVTSGAVTAATNWTVTSQRLRIYGKAAQLMLLMTYNGPNVTTDSTGTGNILDQLMATINTPYRGANTGIRNYVLVYNQDPNVPYVGELGVNGYNILLDHCLVLGETLKAGATIYMTVSYFLP